MSDFEPKPDVPLGKRFTDVYRSKGEPAHDSPRMRRRIAATVVDYGPNFEKYAEQELGISTPWSQSKNWSSCLAEWPIEDVMNVITILIEYVNGSIQPSSRKTVTKNLTARFNRILEQENVSYRVDDQGGVHYVHDAEFVRNAQATIAGLNRPRYANSRDRFDRGMEAISSAPPDGKTGIRNVFEAAEGLFRIMFSRAARLAPDQITPLEPLIQKRYSADRTACGSAMKMLASFKDWIEACHYYRHEAGTPDNIHQPPIELAVHLMSVGAAFIRLLIELDDAAAVSPKIRGRS